MFAPHPLFAKSSHPPTIAFVRGRSLKRTIAKATEHGPGPSANRCGGRSDSAQSMPGNYPQGRLRCDSCVA
jgi:hypothetical protein